MPAGGLAQLFALIETGVILLLFAVIILRRRDCPPTDRMTEQAAPRSPSAFAGRLTSPSRQARRTIGPRFPIGSSEEVIAVFERQAEPTDSTHRTGGRFTRHASEGATWSSPSMSA